MRRLATVVALVALSHPTLAFGATRSQAEVETRALALQKEFRCLVCQGESLDESNAPLAEDLRQIIRERIRSGDSDEQVKQYLAARYGPFILLRPPVESDTYLLWLAPVLLIAAGGGALWAVARNARSCLDASPTEVGNHVLESSTPPP